MNKTKSKTSADQANAIFKKNLAKAAKTLVSLLDSKDEVVRLSATEYILKKITEQPTIIVIDRDKKNST
jgi:HEAT repeat protein